MIPGDLLRDALRELQTKSRQEIETETAFKWAARALAAYTIYFETGETEWLFDAIEYHHEAVEHAADTPVLLEIVQTLADERLKVT